MVGTGTVAAWCWSDFEEIPHVQGQGEATAGGAKSRLESNPTPARDTQVSNTVHTRAQRPPRDQDRTASECLLSGTGRQRTAAGAGLWVKQIWVWHKPSWRSGPLTPPQNHRTPSEFTQDCGSRLWEGTSRTVCAPGPRRKEQRPHRRLTQTCPWVSSGSVGRQWPAAGLGTLRVPVHAWELLNPPLFSLPPPEFGLRSNNRNLH